MAEENMPIRLTNMESKMKLVLNAIENLTKQVEFVHGKLTPTPASIEVLLPPQSTGKEKASASDSQMPLLEDDPLPLAIKKTELVSASVTEHDKRLAKIEEMLKQLQGPQHAIPLDLSVYKRVKMPEKFKMPEFEKYNGTSCPRHHLHMYHVRMTQYVNNELLMIQTFQASLTGPALTWYMLKDVDAFKSWDDVADAFLKQYQFNLDVTFSRDDLECTEKKKSESFKEYATRWRNLAAQVTPELSDPEQMKLFIKSLPYEYRHRLVGATAESLNRLVPIAEQIETGLRDGWFTDPASTSKRLNMKKEKEPMTDVDVAYTQIVRPSPTNQMSSGQQPISSCQQPQRRYNKKQFTPLPRSLSQVLTILHKKNLLSAEPKRPNPENFLNYNPSKKCDYHMGEIGHSTDECYALKHRVQNLLDTKAFSFQMPKPNVQNNPLPEHESEVNAIFG